MNLSHVLVRPIVTEKSTIMQERGKYTFEIARDASKVEVAKAVSKTFNVTVTSVRTMRVRGKMKRFGRRVAKQPDFKKAIVSLKTGDTIKLFEGA